MTKLAELSSLIRSKNAGVDKLEPYEVRDTRPSGDPIREGA